MEQKEDKEMMSKGQTLLTLIQFIIAVGAVCYGLSLIF